MRSALETFKQFVPESWKQSAAQRKEQQTQARLDLLIARSQQSGQTVFEIIARTDRWHRNSNEQAIVKALEQGYSVYVHLTPQNETYLSASSINHIVLQWVEDEVVVYIVMKSLKSGESAENYVSSYEVPPKDCNLIYHS